MNKRRFERIKVNNLVSDLSDGFGFFSGTVSDISCYGMLLDDVPKKFNDQTKKLTLIVSANGKNFKILAIPKWVSKNNQSKSMGIEILNAPSGWTDFVKKHKPKQVDDDVWSAVAVTH
jgi:hypothetical protein